MTGDAALAGRAEGLLEHGIGEEVAVGDRLGDAGQILVDDATGADVQVAHLGVSHLALGQPDGVA